MKIRQIVILILTISICSHFTSEALFSQQATAQEKLKTMKTYPFGDPNPVANIGTIYPYFRFDGFSSTGEPQEWKMVVLENPYIKLWVTPEIGGKLWGAVEKSTQEEFIYFNKVVKFRNIAMRGPWTSGGIEFNFGIIGHTPTTATPVDYVYRTNPDGSVSCIIGAMDLPSRTQWRVNIRLPKDKAYVETECFWFNPTPLHQPLYHWMTAAEDVSDDLKYYYPGSNYIGHPGDAHPWPTHENGRDVSLYSNNDFGGSKSYHILGEYDEHFGGYWEDREFGYGHWARYDDKPGQKLWIWSLARNGEIWHDLLTDKVGNPQYTEPQTGLLFNQEAAGSTLTPFKHAYFEPQSVNRWKEIWYPIKEIGGMVDGSPYGSLNVSRKDNTLHIGICALQAIDEELVVKTGAETIFTKRLSLKPMDVFEEGVTLADQIGEIVVNVGDKKLFYSSTGKETNTLSRPLLMDDKFDWDTAEGCYIAGEEFNRQRRYEEALTKYTDCLEKDPSHNRAMTRIAELYYRHSKYDIALDFASRVLAIDTYSPGGNFIYALINRKLGKLIDAKEGFGWAARSMEYKSAAYTQMAGIFLQENDLSRAAEYAGRSLDYNRYNLTGYQIQAVAHRLEGNTKVAEIALKRLLEIDPLNHIGRYESYQLNRSSDGLKEFKSLIRSEFPHETHLEIAMFYVLQERWDEAIQILEAAPSYPIIDYWLAYLYRDRDPQKSQDFLQKAVTSSPRLVFPFRTETLDVLKWAASQEESWQSRYYMALILWNMSRTEEAIKLFEGCTEIPDYPPFYLTKGNLYLSLGERGLAHNSYLEAYKMDRGDWRTGHILTDFYLLSGQFDEALKTAELNYTNNLENYVTAMDYARSLIKQDRFADSLAILNKTTVLPYEGASEGHDVYREANIIVASQELASGNTEKSIVYSSAAKEWPENLGVGRPFVVDERLENFLIAMAYEKAGNKKNARKYYEDIIQFTQEHKTTRNINDYLAILSLKKLGRESAARSMVTELISALPSSKSAIRWIEAKLSNDTDAVKRLEEDTGINNKHFLLLIKVSQIVGF
ncbi:DUF5107 domain-containing protein [Acidobacteriota bacterium]